MMVHLFILTVNKFGVNKPFCYGSIHVCVVVFVVFLGALPLGFGFHVPMFHHIHLREAICDCNGLGPVKKVGVCEV